MGIADRECSIDATVGAIPVVAYMRFRADRLIGFSLMFSSDHFDVMQRAFLERFGAPTAARDEPGKTGAGVEYLNRRLAWRGQKVRVVLVRFACKITSSSAS